MTEATQTYDASQGWTLMEALRRTTDPAKWQELEKRKQAIPPRPDFPRVPGASIWDFPRYDYGDGARLNAWIRENERCARAERNKFVDAANATWNEIHAAFVHHLKAGLLVARGSRGGASVEPHTIRPESWDGLRICNWDGSAAIERSGDKKKLLNVRIVPAIHSDLAPRLLANLTLAEAFAKYILSDPEFDLARACVARQVQSNDDPSRENGGKVASFGNAFFCPLYASAAELAHSLFFPGVPAGEAPLPELPGEMIRAGHVLADRLGGLRLLLRTERVMASGMVVSTGEINPIPRLAWIGRDIVIDTRNGNVCLRQIDGTCSPQWSEVVLELATSPSAVEIAAAEISEHLSRRSSNKGPSPHVETTAKARRECEAWLCQEISLSRSVRPKPKDRYWEDAKARWPKNLTRRSFDEAWKKTINETGANAWSHAGAPRKQTMAK